jgi:hypothetical protein
MAPRPDFLSDRGCLRERKFRLYHHKFLAAIACNPIVPDANAAARAIREILKDVIAPSQK